MKSTIWRAVENFSSGLRRSAYAQATPVAVSWLTKLQSWGFGLGEALPGIRYLGNSLTSAMPLRGIPRWESANEP